MYIEKTRVTPVLPKWNLGVILEALSKPACEPLVEAFPGGADMFKKPTQANTCLSIMTVPTIMPEFGTVKALRNIISS